jgi:hypothetical protein
VAVRFGYDPVVNARLKDHGARWDPEARAWHVATSSLPVVLGILRIGFGMEVRDDTRFGRREASRRDPVVVDRVAFYEAMLLRLPERDRQAKYRDLMRAFHPDACGDAEEATAINVAFDRVQGRVRRGA